MTRVVGRPTNYNEEIASIICARMSDGESLRSICRCDDMPSMGAVFKWLAKHEEFREQYGLAMSARADSMFEEMLDIADDGTNDWMLTNDGDERFNTEHVQRSRLRLDTRKWMLARMSPRKYGDKQELQHSGQIGLKSLGDLMDELSSNEP